MKGLTEEQFINFFEENHPEKLKYNPKILDIVGNNVVFEMEGHKGTFCVNITM